MVITESEKIRTIARLGGKKYLALSAFAKFTCMAYSTAKRLSESGALRTISVGGVTRVPTDEVLRFLTEGNAPQRPSQEYNSVMNTQGDPND